MNIEEKFNKDVQWLLNEIQAELLVNDTETISYLFIKDDDAPKEREQKRIIHWLTEIGAIKRLSNISQDISIFSFNPLIKLPTIGYRMEMDRSVLITLSKIYDGDLSKKSPKVLIEQAQALKKSQRLETEIVLQKNILPFINEKNKSIIFLGKKVEIPVGNQWVLCKELFKIPAGNWVKESDVIENFGTEGKQSFYDAQRLLNARIAKELGIEDFIEYQTAMARINPKTIEKLNHSGK